MKLLKFRAEGFRSLKQIPFVNLSQNDLTIITGQNDGGKTSFLDAITILLKKNASPAIRDYYKNGKQSNICSKFEGLFLLSDEEKKTLEHFSNECHLLKTCYRDGDYNYAYYTKTYPGDARTSKLSILKIEDLKSILDDHNIPCTHRGKKSTILEAIKTWLNTQILTTALAAAPTNLLTMLPEAISFSSSQSFNPKKEIQLTLKASFKRRISEERYTTSLSTIGNTITEEMKTDLVEFETILKRYCDDVEEMDIIPQFDFTNGFTTTELLLTKQGGVPIIFETEGEGRKRRFTLAIHEWRKNILISDSIIDVKKNNLITYDEPDTHLDYQSQREILDIIKNISDHELNSVIICTHSLNLIDRIPIMDIIHLYLKDGITEINILDMQDNDTIDHFLYNINDSMGLKNSILLNEKCFLIVEGLTKMGALPVLFNKYKNMSLQAAGIRLLNGYNCGSARLYAKFLNNNRKDVLFLVDSDVKTNQANIFNDVSLVGDGFDLITQVNYVGDVEFEDAFSDDVWARTANLAFKKATGIPWTTDEFTRLRVSDFATEVRNMLWRETHMRITKPIMGLAIAKAINNETEIPQAIKDCFDNAFNLVG